MSHKLPTPLADNASYPMLNRLCTLVLVILVFTPVSATLAAGGKAVLLLGDSLGASYGVPPGQGWARQLDKQLDSINLINASISGDTTAGGLARLEALLKRENPDWILI